MNSDLHKLRPYPFSRLQSLLSRTHANPRLSAIDLALGEPRQQPPKFVIEALAEAKAHLGRYPLTRGGDELRDCCARWAEARFGLNPHTLDEQTMVLPVNGTREALFSFTQAIVDRTRNPLVLMPNPFYQIYEGAALLAGAQPVYLDSSPDTGYFPDLDTVSAATWDRCQLFFLCSPNNPTGAVASLEYLRKLLALSEQYQFVIASDECYSEIFLNENEPPPGLLGACKAAGNERFERCVVFHSLSKRSALPGLRSGFVAGDASLIRHYGTYRTYHGCAMPGHHQWASICAWRDEQHVAENRADYVNKFSLACPGLAQVLEFEPPVATFYIWAGTPIDDEQFALGLYSKHNLRVLPGRYLGRTTNALNPGRDRVRISMVGTAQECVEAAERIQTYCEAL